jgi:hypothetical protein
MLFRVCVANAFWTECQTGLSFTQEIFDLSLFISFDRPVLFGPEFGKQFVYGLVIFSGRELGGAVGRQTCFKGRICN